MAPAGVSQRRHQHTLRERHAVLAMRQGQWLLLRRTARRHQSIRDETVGVDLRRAMPPRRHPEDFSSYGTAQVCLNGHLANLSYHDSPEFRQEFCNQCGARTVTQCQSCGIETTAALSRLTRSRWPRSALGAQTFAVVDCGQSDRGQSNG